MIRGACGNPETPCGPFDTSHEKTEWTHKDDEARAEWERFSPTAFEGGGHPVPSGS